MVVAGVCFAQESADDTTRSTAPQPANDAAAGAAPVDPNAPPPRKPFFKRWISPEAVAATLPGAVIQQFHDWPEEWGRNRYGFEKRVASLYAQFAIGVAIEDGVKAIHYEDTRYRRRGHGNFFARTGYAIEHTVLARKTDGRLTMAYSMPANAYGSWAIATLWSPHEFRTVGSIFEWGSAGVGVSVGTNLLREFWPDIQGAFKKKSTAGTPGR